MGKLLKKIILSFFAFFFVAFNYLTILAPTVKAQSTWYSQNPFEWYVKVYDEETSPSNEIFGERYTAAQVQWITYSIFWGIFNAPFTLFDIKPSPVICWANANMGSTDVGSCTSILFDFGQTIVEKINNLLPQVGSNQNENPPLTSNTKLMWKEIFSADRPISAITYINNIGKKLTFVKEAQAATSFGFSRLSVISDLWKISRNIAYFLFVIFIIFSAFLIMFKVKISPQAVVTIQSALPKVILSLVCVTFSFAIAGLLIDLVYVFMGIFSMFFDGTSTFNFINGSLVHDGAITVIMYSAAYLLLYLFAMLSVFTAALINLNLAGTLYALILAIFSIIIFIIFVFNFFLVIFALFKALAGFYFAVIIGPIQLAAGAFPTSKNAIGNWIKSLVSKLAVFPVTGALYYLSLRLLLKAIVLSFVGIPDVFFKITEFVNEVISKLGLSFTVASGNTGLWAPPVLGDAASASAIAFVLMSLACIMIIPKVSKAIESAFAGRPFDYESAIGQPIKMAGNTIGNVAESTGKSKTIFGIPIKHAPWVEGAGRIIQSASR